MPVMSTDLKLLIKSFSSKNTEKIAEQIGINLVGGEVIVLESDLGGGKTVFVRGLARGAGSKEKVASPTFTISKVYKCKKFNLYHFDFYRLKDPGIIAIELKELISDKHNVVVIEWADIIKNILPKQALEIIIKNQDANNRDIIISYVINMGYLIKGIKL